MAYGFLGIWRSYWGSGGLGSFWKSSVWTCTLQTWRNRWASTSTRSSREKPINQDGSEADWGSNVVVQNKLKFQVSTSHARDISKLKSGEYFFIPLKSPPVKSYTITSHSQYPNKVGICEWGCSWLSFIKSLISCMLFTIVIFIFGPHQVSRNLPGYHFYDVHNINDHDSENIPRPFPLHKQSYSRTAVLKRKGEGKHENNNE